MSQPTTCQSRGCDNPVDLAIRSIAPRSKEGLVSTLYQFPEDAPSTAGFYCIGCGMRLARELARLSNPEGAPA